MNKSEADMCEEAGEPGLVEDHGWVVSGVVHHILDESGKSDICEELGTKSGIVNDPEEGSQFPISTSRVEEPSG